MSESQSIPLGHPEIRLPDDQIIQMYSGLNEHFARQLIEKSREEIMLRYVPDDANRRFKDEDSIDLWLPDREVFLLADEQTQDLGGIVWYGPKRFPKELPSHIVRRLGIPTHTFAIRLYDGYRGTGLAQDFMRQTFGEYMSRMYERGDLQNYNGLWLKAKDDNPRALYAYSEFGYDEAVRDDDNHDIYMILSREKSGKILKGA